METVGGENGARRERDRERGEQRRLVKRTVQEEREG